MKKIIKIAIVLVIFTVGLYLTFTVFLLPKKPVNAFDVNIELIQPNNPVSGMIDIMAVPDQEVDQMQLVLINDQGNLISDYFMNSSSTYALGYHIFLDTTKIKNGSYFLKTQAKLADYPGAIYYSNIVNLNINNSQDFYFDIVQPFAGEHLSGTTTLKTEAMMTANPNEDLVLTYSITGAFDGVNISTKKIIATSSKNFYIADWPTIESANGGYTIISELFKQGQVFASGTINVYVDNNINHKVRLIDPQEGENISSSTTIKLRAEVDTPADSLDFVITRQGETQGTSITGEEIGASLIYESIWDLNNFNNDSYNILVKAIIKGNIFSDSVNIVLGKATNQNPQSISIEDPVEQSPEKEIEIIDSPRNVEKSTIVTIHTKTNFQPEEVMLSIDGEKSEEIDAEKVGDYEYQFNWETDNFPTGFYLLKVLALSDGNSVFATTSVNLLVISKSNEASISEESQATDEESGNKEETKVLDQEKLESNLNDNEENKNLHESSTEKVSSTDNAVTNNSDVQNQTDNTIKQTKAVDPTLQITDSEVNNENNINTKGDKEEIVQTTTKKEEKKVSFTSVWHAPEKCQKRRLTTKESCNEYLKLPQICQENFILKKDKCNNFLDLPYLCQEKKILKKEDCQKYLFNLALNSDCRLKNIKTQTECQKFLLANSKGVKCDIQENANSVLCKLDADLTEKSVQTSSRKECFDITEEKKESCNKVFEEINFPKECKEVFITDKKECDRLLFERYGLNICAQAGIIDNKECRAYIHNRIFLNMSCRDENILSCLATIDAGIGKITAKQAKFSTLASIYFDNPQKSFSVAELKKSLPEDKKMIPLVDDKTKVKILPAKEKTIINKYGVEQLPPVFLVLDDDGDGLSNDQEKRIGTDPNSSDSDKDGYDDLTEYLHGYNPLGKGKTSIASSAIDKVIINRVPLELPQSKKLSNKDLIVNKIVNASDKNGNLSTGYIISGKAASNTVLSLFIYSDLPILATVRTDEFGNWQYIFSKSLLDGKHEVYATVNDNTGRILERSDPYLFFVREAKAVTADDFVALSTADSEPQTKSMIKYYVVFSTLFIIIGLGLFLFYFKNYHQKTNKEQRA